MKLSLILILTFLSTITLAKELTIYTSRKEHLLKPLLKQYTKLTGVKFNLKTGKDGALIQGLIAEGKQTPADILMTVDAGNLWFAKKSGLFSKVTTGSLPTMVPSHLKDSDNHWFGLSIRARTIVYHQDRVKPSEIISYENFASSTFKNRLCLRTSKKVYNQSLVSMLIFELGPRRRKRFYLDG